MEKKKNQRGKGGNRRVDSVHSGGSSHDPVSNRVLQVECGTGQETEASTDRTLQNLTVEQIETKVAMQIIRQLEMLNLQQLIDVLEFIGRIMQAREDEPLNLDTGKE